MLSSNRSEPVIFLFSVIFFLMAALIEVSAQPVTPKNKINIGFLLDMETEATSEYVHNLQREVSNLLKTKYAVEIAEKDIIRCDWSIDCIEENYRRLVNDSDIDIIIGLGVLSSGVLTKMTEYPKPVLVAGVIDPTLQQVPITPKNTSGVHNLTYLIMPHSLEEDMDAFHRLYSYGRIALVEDRRLLETMPEDNSLADYLSQKGITLLNVPIDSMETSVDGLSEKVDAVLIGSLYRFEKKDRAKLIEKINIQNLPTFSIWGAADLDLGALSATKPQMNMQRIFRRMALNIERIVDGEDPAELPLTIERQRHLYVNMDTARKIGFSPAWDIIMEAELVNPISETGTHMLGLRETIHEALSSNRTLEAQRKAYQIKEEDVALSKTELFPQLSLSANGTVINENNAVNGQAERTTSGAASLGQVIFSEQLFSNVTVKKHELNASLHSLNQVELNTVQDAGTAYLNILKAATNRRIRKDYLDLVKQNLTIANNRLKVGYAGAADVYRWESEMASAKNNLIEAHAAVLSAKQRLNQLLFRPIDEPVEIRDVSMTENLFNIYPEADLRKYLDNPASINIFKEFLVMEARENLPEIKELDEAVKANERLLLSYQRRRYLPNVLLNSQANHFFSRSGAGSEIPLPDDTSWQVGISATLPLFEGGKINTMKSQLRLAISRLEAQKADLVHSLELNLRNNVLDIIAKSFNIRLSKQAAEAGRKSLELVRDSYEKGLVSIVELLDAQNAAQIAELAEANAVYEYFTSYLNLERSMGRFMFLTPMSVQKDFFDRFETFYHERRTQRSE